MSGDPDACVPKAVTDFVFDLYDSVTLSQLPEEQLRLYQTGLPDLNARYFGSAGQPWPSPQSIASECNGHPLFLALYRELAHRQYHATSRPSVRDRCEGFRVYRELFEEIFEQEQEGEGFYVAPTWCFDILNEFVYQFQGFCQIRSAVMATARKHGLLSGSDGSPPQGAAPAGGADPSADAGAAAAAAPSSSANSGPSPTLLENLSTLQGTDAWDAESVFGYLHRLVRLGGGPGGGGAPASPPKPVVYKYLSLFASVALSRLECLLGDYTGCLRALRGPLVEFGSAVVEAGPPDAAGPGGIAPVARTARDVVNGVLGARLSAAYHAGVSYLMLRRYKDAVSTLADMCAGFPHLAASAVAAVGGGAAAGGALNMRSFHHHHHRQGQHDKGQDGASAAALQLQSQLMKQYDRMICLLAALSQLSPNALQSIADDATRRAIRDKLSRGDGAAGGGGGGGGGGGSGGTLEDYFASPKFISVHGSAGGPSDASAPLIASTVPFHRYQTNLFLKEVRLQQPHKTLRSYLKLYTSLPLAKLAAFYDTSEDKVLPLLLSYKSRMRQLEEPAAAGSAAAYGTAMDIHYYVSGSTCHVDEPERQRRFEAHFFGQLAQVSAIGRQAAALDVPY